MYSFAFAVIPKILDFILKKWLPIYDSIYCPSLATTFFHLSVNCRIPSRKWVHYNNPKRRKSWGECPDMPQHRRTDRIFTVPRLCSAFGGTSSVWCIISCWNQVILSQGIVFKRNWCVWAEHWRKNGYSTKRDTTKLSSSMIMLGHSYK